MRCHGDRTRLLSSVTKMTSSSEPLTVDNIRKIWKTEFLPNIKKEIRNELKTEIDKINCSITNLSKRLDSIESSQQMISDKYDSILNSMQSTKKQINDLNNWCEAQDNKINHLNGSVYDAEAAIDSIQQYSRRDCLEISGIPILPLDSPANLTQELGQLIGVTLDKQDISIAHRLPDTKSKKNRFIVKFIRREKRDEFYKSRKHLGGKKASELPSVACEMGKSIHQDSVMYINESLTQYRSELFGRINKFKKDNKYKFLWTNNGKIYLRKHETSQTFTFTTFDEFDEFTTPSH